MNRNRHHELVLKRYQGTITPQEDRELDLIQRGLSNRPLDPLPQVAPIPFDCDMCDDDATYNCECGAHYCDVCYEEHECPAAITLRYNPFLDDTIDPNALSFDPEATLQTGVLSFDPHQARTHMFAEERHEELAADELLQALQNDMNFSRLGRAVARSWGMRGVGELMARKLRKTYLSNPEVRAAAQHFAEVWLREANELL